MQDISKVAILGGMLQILLTMGLGVALGPVLGVGVVKAVYFGAMIALSSTMVVTKILMDRGEIDSLHGRIAVGLLLTQDLSIVAMMAILPRIAEPQAGLLLPLVADIGKALLFVVATYVLGTRIVPWLLFRVAAIQSRELFLLFVVALALGISAIAEFIGLTFAVGAFVAGLIVSESEFSRQALGAVIPLRDVFATLFFVSVGMLIDPDFLLANAAVIAAVVAVILVAKFVICSAVPLVFGYPAKSAIYVGLALVQIGEFSFVLAKLGLERGIISDYLYSMTLVSAAVTIMVTPLAMRLARPFVNLLARIPKAGPFLLREPEAPFLPRQDEMLAHHVVICGYGRIGRELADSLGKRGFEYVVVEQDPVVIREMRKAGIPCVYGDAANHAVLVHANVAQAKVLAVTVPDPTAAELAVRAALLLNSRLDIIARAHGELTLVRLRGAGAAEVVHTEFEAALEFIRHTMHRLGVSAAEIGYLLGGKRARYRGRGGRGEE